jgi:uncharacterized integral membrane protein
MNNSNTKLIIILFLILVASLFLVQNTQVVNIRIIFWTYSLSVSIVIVSMLIVGILIGWFLKSYISYKNNKSKDLDEDIV